MKKILLALVLVIVTVLLVSCNSEVKVKDKLPSSNEEWELISVKPISATSNNVGSRIGISYTIYQNGEIVPVEDVLEAKLITTSDTDYYGGGSYEAAKQGNIKKISNVDEKTYKYLSFTKVEIVVRGE